MSGIPGSGNWLPRLGLAVQHHRGHGRSGGSALHLVPGIRKQGSHAVCTMTVDAGVFRVKDVQIVFLDVCLDLYVSDCESLDISWYLCQFLIRFDVFSCFLAIWAATDAHFSSFFHTIHTFPCACEVQQLPLGMPPLGLGEPSPEVCPRATRYWAGQKPGLGL